MSENYTMLEELGSGSFGVVYKAIERSTGELVAIKHIDLEGSDDDIREIQQEISLLSTCASPFVTQYKTSFVRGVKLWIVMEYLGGGSCLDLLKPGAFPEAYIAIVCRELLLGLDYLHQTGKIHRDIKAANVLLSQSGKVKIADFGVAAQLSNIKSQRMTFVGTPFWMAPEVIQESGYDFKADIWSLGITAMELGNGEPPNASIHPMKVLFHIPKAPAPRLEGNFSKEFKDFVAQCLVKDSDKRPTARELLKHRFVQRAGKVEQLRELIRRYQKHDSRGNKENHARYYEETLKDLSPQLEQDEWVFETIKPSSVLPKANSNMYATTKRRKISRIPSDCSERTNPYETLDGPPAAYLERMELNNAPLGTGSPARTPMHSSVVRKISQGGQTPSRRKSSALTAVRVASGNTPTSRKSSSTYQQQQHQQLQQLQQGKSPLGLDMSFGNSPSTVRQFRRVSSGSEKSYWQPEKEKSLKQQRRESVVPLNADALSSVPDSRPAPEPRTRGPLTKTPSTASTLIGGVDDDVENTPPSYYTPASPEFDPYATNPFSASFRQAMSDQQQQQQQQSAMPPPPPPPQTRHNLITPPLTTPTEKPIPITPILCTKESLLGRRAHAKAIEPIFAEQLASTAGQRERDALSRLAGAWSVLDRVDPGGEFLLLKALVDKLKADPKLAAALGLDIQAPTAGMPTPKAAAAPPLVSPVKVSDKLGAAQQGGRQQQHHRTSAATTTGSTSSTASTAVASISSSTGAPTGVPATPKKQRQSHVNPPLSPSEPGLLSPTSAQKLILAQENPHLRSHRRRQSALLSPSGTPASSTPSSLSGHHKAAEKARPKHTRGQSEINLSALLRADADKELDRMPGYVVPGMEAAGGIAEALYGRWIEGLRGRWGN